MDTLEFTEGRLIPLAEMRRSRFEVAGEGGEPAKITGIISIADAENSNSRLYPLSLWEKCLPVVNEEIDRHPGLADHPEGNASVTDIAVRWSRFWLDGKEVWGEGYIVPTVKGKDCEAIIRSGVSIGISTRGWGSIQKMETDGRTVWVVQDDYYFGSADLVAEPSVEDARITHIENVDNATIEDLTLEVLRLTRPDLLSLIEEEVRACLENVMSKDKIEQEIEAVAEVAATSEEEVVETPEIQVEETVADVTEAVVSAELTEAQTALEEAKTRIAELETEHTALAEDAANLKAMMDLMTKEIGELAAKEDFYGAASVAMMGDTMASMHDRAANQAPMEGLVTAVTAALEALGVQNLHSYIAGKCRVEKNYFSLVDSLKSCRTKEEVDSKFDELKAILPVTEASTKSVVTDEAVDPIKAKQVAARDRYRGI